MTLGAAAAAACIGLTACSSSGSSSGGTPAGNDSSSGTADSSAGVATAAAAAAKYLQAPTTISQTTPLKSPPAKGKSLIYLTNGVPSDTQIARSEAEAAKAIGWNFKTVTFDAASPASLTTAFENALQMHPTAVSVGGSPESLITQTVQSDYAKAGVPIIENSTYPVTPGNVLKGPVDSIISPTNGGKAIADWFINDSKGKGQAVLVDVTAFPVLHGFDKGFEAEIKALCPGCSSSEINITAPQLAAGKIVPTTVSYLQSHPKVKYVFFSLGNWADGITSALNAASLSGLSVGGYDPDNESTASLKNKTEDVWFGHSNFYTGLSAVDAAIRLTQNMPLDGNADQPAQLLTQDNIGDTVNWNAPYDALAQFEKLWGVPQTACTVACSATAAD